MNTKVLKYLAVLQLPIVVIISFFSGGWWSWLAVFYTFGFIPIIELFISTDVKNMSKAEEEIAKKDKMYDYLVYMIVPLQYSLLGLFLYSLMTVPYNAFELVGRILAMGISCATLGINVGHELGHRRSKFEKTLAKSLLLSTMYMHFIIEHNLGHHKNVSTEEDPASARRGQWLYPFLIKSALGGYLSAWKLETERLAKKKLPFWSYHNEMILFTIIQTAFVLGIFLLFGPMITLYFLIAATLGFLFLETINYVEHYGLHRKKAAGKKYYEKVQPFHSWNSNFIVGRVLLFELTRHSDHHYNAGRKYQILRNFEDAPHMPMGYPGMIVLALFPPLFFWVMHPVIDKYKEAHPGLLA